MILSFLSSRGWESWDVERRPASVPHAVLWDAIASAYRPPRLVILNLYRWPMRHRPGPAHVESLICWPDLVDDNQARSFTRELHGELAAGETVRTAFTRARRATCGYWPNLEPPTLHGKTDRPIY